MSPSPPPPEQEFHTWSEIAGYLGISVREAQNRENSDGLPVRRIGSGKKPRVWALRSELDAWKVKASSPPPPAPPAPPRPNWTRRSLIAAGGLAAAGAAFHIFTRTPPRIERAVLTGDLLTALDGLGKPIWEHRFSGPLQEPKAEDLPWRVQILDLEGAGNPGVVVVCSHTSPGFPAPTHDDLVYFAPDGQIRWTIPCRPDLLDAGGKPFEPEWQISHVLAVPAGKRQDLWVAARHFWAWPGCVMRIDPKGRTAIQFANAGHVEWLCLLPSPRDHRIAVAGENNAYESSCAAVLGLHDPPSSSAPGGRPTRRFANGPAGAVRDYILFPTTEMLTAGDSPYGHAFRVNRTATASIIIEIQASSSGVATLLYEFSPSIAPLNVMPSGSCAPVHNRLQRGGKLHHSWADCPELRKPLTIRHWKPATGWRDEPVPWRGIGSIR
ncbi:MAG: hypothetical protein JST11_09075 [Acidobacteria bacterium]|nr:hypothetical protein [Acidobacteriota bacterium]